MKEQERDDHDQQNFHRLTFLGNLERPGFLIEVDDDRSDRSSVSKGKVESQNILPSFDRLLHNHVRVTIREYLTRTSERFR